jgi:hypothetical protein
MLLEITGTKRAAERFDSFPVSNIYGIQLYLKKSGSPTGTATLNIRKVSDDSIIGNLGTIDVSTLTTTFTYYTFAGFVYNNAAQDIRIGLEWAGISGAHYVYVGSTYNSDPYAGGVMSVYVSSWNDYYKPPQAAACDMRWKYLCYADLGEGGYPTCPPTSTPAPTCPPTPTPSPTPSPTPTPSPSPTPEPGCGLSDWWIDVGVDGFYYHGWCYENITGNVTIRASYDAFPETIEDGFYCWYGASGFIDYLPELLDPIYYTAFVDGFEGHCHLQIGGEGMAAINSTLGIYLTLGLALGLSLLSLKLGAFGWFITAWAWVGLALQADYEWQGIVAGLMALFCMTLFIVDAMHGRGRK